MAAVRGRPGSIDALPRRPGVTMLLDGAHGDGPPPPMLRGVSAPVAMHRLDPLTARALGILPGHHLAVRPDGVPLTSGAGAELAAATTSAAAPGPRLDLGSRRADRGRNSSGPRSFRCLGRSGAVAELGSEPSPLFPALRVVPHHGGDGRPWSPARCSSVTVNAIERFRPLASTAGTSRSRLP